MGGAVFVDTGAQLEVRRSELRHNSVAGGSFGCCGGAVFLFVDASATLRDVIARENEARDGGQLTNGGAVGIFPGARMGVFTSEVRNNVATSNGQYVQGGGFFVMAAQLFLSESLLGGNLVNARSAEGKSLGGAISTFRSSQLNVKTTVLRNNTARGGDGGAVYIDPGGETEVAQSTFERNSASGPTYSSGGAINVVSAILRIRDSEFRANSVIGGGGAIMIDGDSAVLTNVSLVRNRAVASKDSTTGDGGALSVARGLVRLDGCRLHDNVAESLRGAIGAIGGGVYVGSGDVRIERSTMGGNRMGGTGYSQAEWSSGGGAYVFADGGVVVIDGCSVLDGSSSDLENPARCLLMAKRTLLLNGSSFNSTTPGQGLLVLFDAALQLVIRGCTISNLPIFAYQPNITIGVVTSTFAPALDPSVRTVLPDPHCGAEIAGAPLCDPRATCERAPSGGVQCACTGQGLRGKPGMFADGQQCEQEPSVAMLLQSQAVSITVPKPSNGSAPVQVVVRAGGESRMMAAYTASMVHRSATAGEGAQPNSSRTWSRLDESQLSLDGHHVVWSSVPPANDSTIELDGKAKRYAATKEYAFHIGLDCHGEGACVADGDTVETELEVASESGGGVRSAVRITTLVQSLVSCEHSKAWVEYDLQSVSTSTAMRVHLEAYDVDMLPISYSRAPVEFRFGSQLLPQRWAGGSNEYVADVSADDTESAGQYELVVTALKGWSSRRQAVCPCELLRRSIEVKTNKAHLILAGCLAGVMALTLGVLAYLLHRKQEELKQALLSFLSFEGLLVMELCLEVWVTAPPSHVCVLDGAQLPFAAECSGRRLLLPHSGGVQAERVGEQYAHPVRRFLLRGICGVAPGWGSKVALVTPQVALASSDRGANPEAYVGRGPDCATPFEPRVRR
jgi:hypothetical protein